MIFHEILPTLLFSFFPRTGQRKIIVDQVLSDKVSDETTIDICSMCCFITADYKNAKNCRIY
jgi:hypothetical protein